MIKNDNKNKFINIKERTENKEKVKGEISTFKIAATYIGTVVGAGFASGQEVLQFFGYYGIRGFLGLGLTTILFVIYGYIILKLGQEYHASSHLKVIRHAGGKWLGFFIDMIITIFLFGALTAMIAGSGAIFKEQLGIHSFWGNIIMTVTALGTALLGIGGVISAISFVVPLLLTGVITLVILTILTNLPLSLADLSIYVPGEAAVPNWILSAFNYASYNLVIAVAVLAPLGNETRDKNRLKTGSILGGVGLGFGAAAILLAILLNIPESAGYEIPMVFIAGQFSPTIQLIYSGILVAEIYTTAVGNLYGFAVRLVSSTSRYYRNIVIITSLTALAASQFGFSNLVRYLYPAVGYAGLLMLLGLTVGIFRENQT